MSKITISLIKADVGGWPGHSTVHPALKEVAESVLAQEKAAGKIIDFKVMAVGDDLQLMMTLLLKEDSAEIHGLARDVVCKATEKAEELMTMKPPLTGPDEATTISDGGFWKDLTKRWFPWIWSIIRWWIIVLLGILKDTFLWRLTEWGESPLARPNRRDCRYD